MYSARRSKKGVPDCVTGKAPRNPEKRLVQTFGALAYRSLDRFFVLDQPVRQESGPLLDALTHLRNGEFHDSDLHFWSSRQHQYLPDDELAAFSLHDGDTLFAHSFNKDRADTNAAYVKGFPKVFVSHAHIAGNGHTVGDHKHLPVGMAKAVATKIYLAIGMMVKLTVNICPELGLYNNSRGVVRDIVYGGDGSYPSHDASWQERIPVVWVEFADYKGPPLDFWKDDPAKKKWWPVSALEKRCDLHCCSRTGLPLVVGKADTIHGLQGLTVGDHKAIKRLLIDWSLKAENLFPGALYVAGSRAQDVRNVALKNSLCQSELDMDRTKSATWRAQSAEMKRINDLAFAARAAAPVTADAYRDMIVKFCDCVVENMPAGIDEERRELIRSCATQWRDSAQAPIVDAMNP